jgi:hypothetical protein
MAQTYNPSLHRAGTVHVTEELKPAHRAYQVLHFAFAVAPIVAGLDKFFNLLGNWEQYLAPVFPRTLGLSAPGFMKIVGVIEIIAGIGIVLKPRIFGYVVSAWLFGIILNLLILGNYFDVALRDLGLAMSAFALAKLAEAYE